MLLRERSGARHFASYSHDQCGDINCKIIRLLDNSWATKGIEPKPLPARHSDRRCRLIAIDHRGELPWSRVMGLLGFRIVLSEERAELFFEATSRVFNQVISKYSNMEQKRAGAKIRQ